MLDTPSTLNLGMFTTVSWPQYLSDTHSVFSSILVICLYCCSLLFTNRQRTFFFPSCAAFLSRPQGLLFLILNSNLVAGAKIQMYVIYGQEDQPIYVPSVELNHSLCWLHFNIFSSCFGRHAILVRNQMHSKLHTTGDL